MYSDINKIKVFFVLIKDFDNEDIGIDEENDEDELFNLRKTKNAKKHDYISSRTKKIRNESSVVKRPRSKKKFGKN